MSASSDYTLTPSLGLYKPIANRAVGLWGDLWNSNADALDAAIHFASGGGPFLPLAGNATVFGPTTFSASTTFSGPVTFNDGSAGTINVLMHGAKGDGTTDDTAAIQAALNTYAGKAVVFIPDTGSSYRTSKIAVPSGTDLLIHGTVLALPGTDVMFDLNNVHDVTIRGHGTIDSNFVTPSAGLAVCINTHLGTSNVRISELTMQNSANFGLAVTASSYVYVDSVRLLNCVNANGFNWSSHCWITRCYIDAGTMSNDNAWSFYGGCTDCGISDCEITRARVSGISVYADDAGGPPNSTTSVPSKDIVIANNVCHANTAAGIEVRSREPPYYIHTGVVITGNRCFGNSVSALPDQDADIWISSANGVTISGNSLSASGSGQAAWGVWVGQHASFVSITGNSIYNEGTGGTTGSGIYLQLPTNVLISGNFFYDNQATKTMASAVSGAAGTHVAIIGNQFSGLIGNPIQCTTGADTVIANPGVGGWQVGSYLDKPGTISLTGPVGSSRQVEFDSAGLARWFVGVDGSAESGANAGSNFSIGAVRDDGGGFISSPIIITRATGMVTFAVAPSFSSFPVNAANDAAAAAAGVPVGRMYRNGSALQVRVV